MAATTIRKGDRVTGLGRNGNPWPSRPTGVVTRVHGDFVRVQWDDSAVEDDMRPNEIERNDPFAVFPKGYDQ